MTARVIEGDDTYLVIEIGGEVSYNAWFSQKSYVGYMTVYHHWDVQRAEINVARHLYFALAGAQSSGSNSISYRRYNTEGQQEILLRVR